MRLRSEPPSSWSGWLRGELPLKLEVVLVQGEFSHLCYPIDAVEMVRIFSHRRYMMMLQYTSMVCGGGCLHSIVRGNGDVSLLIYTIVIIFVINESGRYVICAPLSWEEFST